MCNCIHELLNVFEDSAQRERTIVENSNFLCTCYNNLIQNSQAVKKVCGPQKGYGEKRCEIQGGGQEMAVMVG